MRTRGTVVLTLVLAAVICAALVVAVIDPFDADEAPTTDCTAYGLSADDPRAQAPTVTLPDRADEQYGTQDGELGELQQSFTHDGLTSGYHVIDGGVDPSLPVGLVIHLHGDGAQEYDEPEGRVSCLAAVAASHNALLVVPRTPDCTDECTWWQRLDPNREWLAALVEQRLLADLPVERDRITWMGYSGGAEMISYGILPDSPEMITAGAAMVGGGGAPSSLPRQAAGERLEEQPLWWFVGEHDDGTDPLADFDARSAAVAGHELYSERGFEAARLEILPGHDHFDMPDARILDELLVTSRPESGTASD